MKNQTELLSLVSAKWLPSSVNGNPRWRFTARTAKGQYVEFKTASDVSSAYETNLSFLKCGDVIKVRFHETAAGNLIANQWIDSRASGLNLTGQFEALELAAQLRALTDSQNPTHQQQVRL